MKQTNKEQWKQLTSRYWISSIGRVKSINKNGKEKQVKINTTLPYPRVNIGRNNVKYVHRLVAELFIDNIEGKLEVNHKDKNKHNNNINNLEWCNRQENQEHALGKIWEVSYGDCIIRQTNLNLIAKDLGVTRAVLSGAYHRGKHPIYKVSLIS